MDYIKTEGINHYKDRLYIHWDITTLCNYNCSYCYAKKQYANKWQQPAIWSKQLEVIDELSKSTLPLFLGLLGGEPTMHQRYFLLLDILYEKILTHKDSRIYITTNGSKSNDFFKQHKHTDGKIYILWSIHPEYMNKQSFENLYTNILIMRTKGYKNKVNLMLHPAKRYWKFIEYMYKRLNEIEDIDIHPHFIYNGFDNDVNYSDEFYDNFIFLESQRLKEFQFWTLYTVDIFSDYEIFKRGLNQFKGWSCWHNNFEINSNCKISDQCFDRISKDIPPDFFKNITNIIPKICLHNFCSCDGLMKIHKEKL